MAADIGRLAANVSMLTLLIRTRQAEADVTVISSEKSEFVLTG